VLTTGADNGNGNGNGNGDIFLALGPRIRVGAGGDEQRDRGPNFTAPRHYDPAALSCVAPFT
jgi:hypothetical protein